MIDLSKVIKKRFKKKKKAKLGAKSIKSKQKKALKKKNDRILKRVQKHAKELQLNPPKSDQWFQELWKDFKDLDDRYNEAFGHYIPDCINLKYKYIIEVDGSYHLKAEQIQKDIRKNEYYYSRGFDWYRIQAYNEDSLKQVQDKIRLRRERFDSYQSNSLKNKALDSDLKVR